MCKTCNGAAYRAPVGAIIHAYMIGNDEENKQIWPMVMMFDDGADYV